MLNERSRTTGANVSNIESNFSPAALRRRATKLDSESEPAVGGQENTGLSRSGQRKLRPSRSLPRMLSPRSHEEPETPEIHGPFVPYHPLKARPSSATEIGDTFSPFHIHKYIQSLQIPTSTLDEFDYLLQLPAKGKETSYDLFWPLFRVIHDDTQTLADVIRVTLQRVREGSMDENSMQKQVTFWRRLLNRLSFSLAEVDERLRAFLHVTYDPNAPSLTVNVRTETASEKLARETRQTLRSCIDHLDESSKSLLGEMQIVDSRRSIAEAESVSKLTELAFVFIPLSFVASLFSMQIHELSQGVSVYLFVVVAIAFVLVAYTVRLSIRSSRLIDFKRRTLVQIRDESDIHYNQPIPSHVFLVWMGRAVGATVWKSAVSSVAVLTPVILVMSIIGALLSPIILLWLRDISKGFSAVITVLLLLLDAVLIYPVATTASGEFEINPKRIFREIQGNYEIKRKQKAKAKRKRKEQVGIDPESLNMDSDDESEEGEWVSQSNTS